MRWSSCDSFSLTFCAGSGVSKKKLAGKRAFGESREGVAREEGVCSAARGTAVSRMVPRTRTRPTLHFHPAHFIKLSAPLVLDSTVGDPHFVERDYTHTCRGAQFEIFIVPIDFSDADRASRRPT